ncbi:MAG: methyltransferase domain-containing protein [Solirubrobacteraceae bacterium]
MASSREFWDQRHGAAIAQGDGLRAPSSWLVDHEGLLAVQPRGGALDVACGRGRNAVFLAELGFEVQAYDISGVAVDHLSAVARERELPVRAQRLDLRTEPLPGSGYQVILDFYFLERTRFGDLADALAPAGLLLFETFLGVEPRADYGPQDPARVLEPGELRAAFEDRLAILSYREGPPKPGERAVASLVAQAPATS